MDVKDRSSSWPRLAAFFSFLFLFFICCSYEGVHQRGALMSGERMEGRKLIRKAEDKQLRNCFSAEWKKKKAVSPFFFQLFSKHNNFQVDVSRLKQRWKTWELHRGPASWYIHRKDVHHNGPCICETVSKQRRSRGEICSEGQIDVPLWFKLPLYLFCRVKCLRCECFLAALL